VRLPQAVTCNPARRFACVRRPTPGRPWERNVDETLRWFNDPDAAVLVNLRDCCDGLGLDVVKVQRPLFVNNPLRLSPGWRWLAFRARGE
jgi:hypothetical protein